MVMHVLVEGPPQTETFHWNVGESTARVNMEVDRVVRVYADDRELEHIYAKFTNIPARPGARHVRWYGDIAKFIAGNL